MNMISEEVLNGVYQSGKRFESFVDGEMVYSGYNERSAEVAIEKKKGIWTRRKSGSSNSSYGGSIVSSPPVSANNSPSFSERTDEEIYKDIQLRFETIDLMVQASLCGLNKSLVISGPAGLGKSYGVLKALEESGCPYQIVKGHVSPRQLYVLLYENRGSDNILCFDDCDGVFSDEISLNLMKSACDSSDIRNCSWFSSKVVTDSEDNVVPNTFQFDGSIIFITNKNFNAEIEKDNKMSVHFEALRSRSHFISLGINTKRDYLIRIKQVVETTNILGNVSTRIKKDILDFIEENQDRLIELSLRVVNKISDLIKMTSEWKDIARITLMN